MSQNPCFTTMGGLLCPKSRFYHNGSVPEILLLENIILSPTDVSQEPCHSGSVSASAKAQSSSSKKKTVFLQETGFTNMGPCNIYICVCVFMYAGNRYVD